MVDQDPTLARGVDYSGYELVERISVGNFAEVWRGRHKVVIPVAVKIATTQIGARMLEAESSIFDGERLPGIVEVICHGESPRPHIVMPWVGSWTLRDILSAKAHLRQRELLIDRGRIKLTAKGETARLDLKWRVSRAEKEDILAGMRQGRFYRIRRLLGVLAAVRQLHRRGLVHGDLKPENVLIDEQDGSCQLSDFGLAKEMQAYRREQRLDHSMHSEQGLIGGTLTYLPPEGVKGGEPSPAGDVYALGVMLHEVLLFRRPDKARDPGNFSDRVPAPLLRVLTRALAYAPEERYPDATEMTLALRQALITVEVSELIKPISAAPMGMTGALSRFLGVTLLLIYLCVVFFGLLVYPPVLLGCLIIFGLQVYIWEWWQAPRLQRRWQDVGDRKPIDFSSVQTS